MTCCYAPTPHHEHSHVPLTTLASGIICLCCLKGTHFFVFMLSFILGWITVLYVLEPPEIVLFSYINY